MMITRLKARRGPFVNDFILAAATLPFQANHLLEIIVPITAGYWLSSIKDRNSVKVNGMSHQRLWVRVRADDAV